MSKVDENTTQKAPETPGKAFVAESYAAAKQAAADLLGVDPEALKGWAIVGDVVLPDGREGMLFGGNTASVDDMALFLTQAAMAVMHSDADFAEVDTAHEAQEA